MNDSPPPESPLDLLFADLPPQLSIEAAAEVLGRHARTVQKWVRDGAVPAYRLAGSWLILRDELKEWVRAGSNRGGTRGMDEPAGVDEPARPDDRAGPGAGSTG